VNRLLPEDSLESKNNKAFQQWTVPESPLKIEYATDTMEEIRAHAMEGVRQLARGGLEVGGVLFGTRGENLIRITSWRSIDCQHAKGPSFQLSEDDRSGLGDMLQAAKTDPALHGLHAVGWFVSHTRGEVALRESDASIFDHFFPWRWQITLVLQPSKDGSVRAGFFFREPDGTVKADASLREFSLEPSALPRQAIESKEQTKTESGMVPAAPVSVPSRTPLAQVRGSELFRHRQESYPRVWIWILALVMTPIVGWLVIHRPSNSKLPPSFSFHVVDSGGELRLQWDKSAELIREAVRGTLDIKDGSSNLQLPLEGERLRDGSFTYTRKSGDLEILMTVYPVNGSPVQESARFVGPPGNAGNNDDAVQIKRERDSLADEVDRLREALRKQTTRNRELEDLVRILENRLEIDGPHKKP
jgi:hypothetical protein